MDWEAHFRGELSGTRWHGEIGADPTPTGTADKLKLKVSDATKQTTTFVTNNKYLVAGVVGVLALLGVVAGSSNPKPRRRRLSRGY